MTAVHADFAFAYRVHRGDDETPDPRNVLRVKPRWPGYSSLRGKVTF